MKLYQLIKDLQGEGATKALTHLITLDTLITQLENYVSESDDEARAWDITVRYKDALKEKLTFSIFCHPQTTPIYVKGFVRCSFFGCLTDDKGYSIFPIPNQDFGVMLYDGKEQAICHTFKELAEATKDKPFELEIKNLNQND